MFNLDLEVNVSGSGEHSERITNENRRKAD